MPGAPPGCAEVTADADAEPSAESAGNPANSASEPTQEQVATTGQAPFKKSPIRAEGLDLEVVFGHDFAQCSLVIVDSGTSGRLLPQVTRVLELIWGFIFDHFCDMCVGFLNFCSFTCKKSPSQGLDFLSNNFSCVV